MVSRDYTDEQLNMADTKTETQFLAETQLD